MSGYIEIIIFLLTVAIFIHIFTHVGFAMPLYFPKITIDITLQKDGRLEHVEERTEEFGGSNTKYCWDITLTNSEPITYVSAFSSGSVRVFCGSGGGRGAS